MVIVRLHEQPGYQQSAGDKDKEDGVLERGSQSLAYRLSFVKLLKVKVREGDPKEAKAGN
jgi:hypothetical protein